MGALALHKFFATFALYFCPQPHTTVDHWLAGERGHNFITGGSEICILFSPLSKCLAFLGGNFPLFTVNKFFLRLVISQLFSSHVFFFVFEKVVFGWMRTTQKVGYFKIIRWLSERNLTKLKHSRNGFVKLSLGVAINIRLKNNSVRFSPFSCMGVRFKLFYCFHSTGDFLLFFRILVGSNSNYFPPIFLSALSNMLKTASITALRPRY